MSDDPFAAFKEGQPPTQEAPAAKAAKKPRKKKAAGNGNGKAKPPAAEQTPYNYAEARIAKHEARKKRKVREAPPGRRKPAKEMRLPISMLLEIGSLSEEESGALLSIGAGLQKLPKKSRGKITAALAKIFG